MVHHALRLIAHPVSGGHGPPHEVDILTSAQFRVEAVQGADRISSTHHHGRREIRHSSSGSHPSRLGAEVELYGADRSARNYLPRIAERLGIPLDRTGPQTGLFGGRFNPIHQMLATGTDAIAGQQDWNKIRYADDTLMLCVQGATHWDALGHIFYEDKAYNGHDAKLIDARGLSVLGIEHSKSKMVGRGVLLDIARFRGMGVSTIVFRPGSMTVKHDTAQVCGQIEYLAKHVLPHVKR